jgi:endonuclease III-like uncharacterized protein
MKNALKIEFQNPSEGRLIISIQGNFVLSEFEKECLQVLNSIEQYNKIQFSLSHVKEMDLASYQFLHFVIQNYSKDKSIKINANMNPSIKNFFSTAGIDLEKL